MSLRDAIRERFPEHEAELTNLARNGDAPSRGIQLVNNSNIAPALGMSCGGRIAILPGQSKAEEFSTLVHETAHELLHKAERRTATTKTVRETEAEAALSSSGKPLVW